MSLMMDNLTDAEPDDGDDHRYRVRLQDVFEGPMDLLVHLIKKAEVDIYDIPISQITAQYLEYLEWMQQMNIDFAGDFVLMASTVDPYQIQDASAGTKR
jgi:segregation and condensation protein A